MKLKKLQWIGKPEKLRITSSSSLICDIDGTSALVHTFSEDEGASITIHADEGLSYGLAVILSSEHGVSLMRVNNTLIKKVSFPQMKDETVLPLIDEEHFSFRKEADTVIFSNGDVDVSAFTLSSIKESVSVAVLFRGKGHVSLSF